MSKVRFGCDFMSPQEREEAGFVPDSDDETQHETSIRRFKNEGKNPELRRSVKQNMNIENSLIRVHKTRIRKLQNEVRSVSNIDSVQPQEPINIQGDKSVAYDEKMETKRSEIMDTETNDEKIGLTYDIGPNTQIAAEAMEALFHGFPLNCEHEEDTCIQNASEISNSTKPYYNEFIRNNAKEVTEMEKSKRKKEESGLSKISLSSNTQRSKYSNFHFDVIPVAPRTKRSKPSKISSWKNIFSVDEKQPPLEFEVVTNLHVIFDTAKRKKRSTCRRKLSPNLGVRITEKKCNGSSVVSPVRATKSAKENSKENINSTTNKAKKSVKKTSISKELSKLETTEPVLHLRKRNYMSKVHVLFSSHLDEDIVKQKKKIMTRFGVRVVSKVEDATHFVADRFTRTKNMLKAMAMGKPIVTHMWFNSCVQANYFIDEKNYILRDVKKEKEYGFSMPVSLARACKLPLFKGRKMIVTPNVKPNREVIESLIKAAQGQIQTMNCVRKTSSKNHISDDMLVISCEEDYPACSSLLTQGLGVYHYDLILNGIIIQKLELDRHRLYKPC